MKIKYLLLGATLLVASSSAWGWSATHLGGQNWAITCANGTSHSYNGSSAGLDTVGPALCPGGIVDPGDPISGPTWAMDNIHKLKDAPVVKPDSNRAKLKATTGRSEISQ